MGVSDLRLRSPRLDITPVSESPQDPCAEAAGWFAQLGLLGLGLVGVAEPNRSRCATLPTPSHATSVSGRGT